MKNEIQKINDRFLHACQAGIFEVVKELHRSVGQDDYLPEGLIHAAKWGYLDIVGFLAPLVDHQKTGNMALYRAVEYGHLDVVKVLIPHLDPSLHKSAPLRIALLSKNQEMLDTLWPVSDVQGVIDEFKRDGYASELFQCLIDRLLAERAEKSRKNLKENLIAPIIQNPSPRQRKF